MPSTPSAPVNTGLPTISGTTTTGQTLTGANGTWSGEVDSYTYQWLRNALAISGATGSTYLLTTADEGYRISFAITAINPGGTTTAISAQTVQVSPLAPVNTALPAITGTTTEGQTLTGTNGTWSNSPASNATQWLRDGVAIPGATSSTYLLTAADVARRVSFEVTATNGSGSTAATSAQTTIIQSGAPFNTVLPGITGTTTQGQTLTSSNGTWTNTPTTYARQWVRGTAPISGATGTTYTLASGDVGASISVQVTASNTYGGRTATSAPASAIVALAPVAPANTALPAITGSPLVGATLTTTNGTWSGSPTGYGYQWKSNGVAISGATSSTYTVVSGDVGKTLTVTVTATNPGGSTAATSAATATVTAPATAPANTSPPTIGGILAVGNTLSGAKGIWSGSPTSFAYQWKADGTAISGATSTTYTLTSNEVGKTITFAVTGTNSAGSATATSAATGAVPTPAPPSSSWSSPTFTAPCPAIKVPPSGSPSAIAGQNLCAAKPFSALGVVWQNDSGQTWNTNCPYAIKFNNTLGYMRFELHDTDWDHGLGDEGSNLSGAPEYFKRRAEAGNTESNKKFYNNTEYWLAFSFLQYWSDPAAMNSGGGNTRIFQMHWPSGNSPAFGFSAVGLGGSNMGFRVSTRQDDQGSNITRCTVPLVNGAANDVVVNFKVVDDGLGTSSSLAGSFLKIWLNGTLVLNFTGGFGTYLEGGSPHGGYTWRHGVYGQPLNGNRVIGVYGNLSAWPSSTSLASRITAPPAWNLSSADWL